MEKAIDKIRTDYPVVMHNNLIWAQEKLTLAATKLLRFLIMQVLYEDTEFSVCHLSAAQFSEACGISRSNVYRDAEKICEELMKGVLTIRDSKGTASWHCKEETWKKFQYVSKASYSSGKFCLQLHDDLSPYLLQLKNLYTTYYYSDIMCMKSTFSIRIYEMLRCGMMDGSRSSIDTIHEVDIYCNDVIRACSIGEKYNTSMLRSRVIERAIEEINSNTGYCILPIRKEDYIKKANRIIGYRLRIVSAYSPEGRKYLGQITSANKKRRV